MACACVRGWSGRWQHLHGQPHRDGGKAGEAEGRRGEGDRSLTRMAARGSSIMVRPAWLWAWVQVQVWMCHTYTAHER
eukprot:2963317-Alexandrium_andersonii.AAC.1